MNNHPQTNSRHQCGQAMVETLVILFVTLLLLLGIIQFGLIYNAKTTLNYAIFQAARAGSLNYANRDAIEYGLSAGLSPLFTSIEESDGRFATVQKVQNARDDILTEVKNGEFVCLERLNPTQKAFLAYRVNDPTGIFTGEKLIPNDHLHYRSSLIKSGAEVSIQDANLLKLRVTYCYPMYVPIISNTIKRVYGLLGESGVGYVDVSTADLTPNGPFQRNCLINDRIPIVAQAIIRMQTPIQNDTFETDCR